MGVVRTGGEDWPSGREPASAKAWGSQTGSLMQLGCWVPGHGRAWTVTGPAEMLCWELDGILEHEEKSQFSG